MPHAAVATVRLEPGLVPFLRDIKRYPILKPEEEYALARRWRGDGDREAAHKLVTSHLRFVAKIAMGYRGYGLPISEVISEGNVGLMEAVKRFEPERGVRLATYAIWWIKASKIGRASCRERGEISGGAGSLKKKKEEWRSIEVRRHSR